MNDITTILDRSFEAGLIVKLTKSKIAEYSVMVLGHGIDSTKTSSVIVKYSFPTERQVSSSSCMSHNRYFY